MPSMEHKPFNRHYWYVLVAIVFVGGLMLGRAYSIGDDFDAQGAAEAAGTAAAMQHIELRHIDVEVQQLLRETLEDDFTEVDELLEEL